jgi:hypothetical protein
MPCASFTTMLGLRITLIMTVLTNEQGGSVLLLLYGAGAHFLELCRAHKNRALKICQKYSLFY